jgi:hypothetical protein
VVIDNGGNEAAEGWPVAVAVGAAEGQADLVGQAVEGLRVVDEQGTEMLLAVRTADGELVERGPVPAGAVLVLPAVCSAQGSAVYYVYSDNPAAGEVPDVLTERPGLANGDVEAGEGATPTSWSHDAGDPQHQASWSEESPQSGKRCLKTVVAPGAEPTWIATRQGGVRIQSGAKYRVRAWVKAQDVHGLTGWYLHVGNRHNPMLIGPMLGAGEGTFDWKEVATEFTAPEGADRLELGTVLRGTGTAWFDHVTLECLDKTLLSAKAEKPERNVLKEAAPPSTWSPGALGNVAAPDRRFPVRIFNFSDQPLTQTLATLSATALTVRTHDRIAESVLLLNDQGQPVPYAINGEQMVFGASVPPNSVGTWGVYSWDQPPGKLPRPAESGASLLTSLNRIKNPSFEAGSPMPEDWSSGNDFQQPGIVAGLDDPGRADFGRHSLRMSVPKDAPTQWRGWRQTVAVEPGKTYLLRAWLKSKDLEGVASVHLHLRTADGELCKDNPMRQIGPPIKGDSDWTMLSAVLIAPVDAAKVEIHLTTDATGTLWHDELFMAEAMPAGVGQFEGRPVAESQGVRTWQVPAVAKVFPDDPAPAQPGQAAIGVARNEKEPLQLAIRSGQALGGVHVEVDPPVGAGGAKLERLAVNVVGYVPMDYPTSYYHSRSPVWQRKFPTAPAGCDGWRGWWPDPLLPRDTFDLAANQTASVWITFQVGKEQPAGDYAGKVRLVREGRAVAEVPFTVHVWNFTLPDESHVDASYDARLGPGGAIWGKPSGEAYSEMISAMAANRLCPDAVQPSPTIRFENGQAKIDFTEFDRAAEHYFDKLGLPHSYTPWEFYLFGWGFPPKDMFGEHPYPGEPPYVGADRSQLRPEYKRVYQACLKAFWDHVKAKGWEKKFILYISDEPFFTKPEIRTQMKALCDMIHEVDPKIPIYSSTWNHVPDWDGYLNVWGIGHYGVVPAEKIAGLRAAGGRVWFTTDGQMCTDTPYCAVERLLPHYCFKYGADAYEFWGVAWHTYDPYRFGWHAYIPQTEEPGHFYWIRYPNGDGFLLYPGKPVGHDGPVSSVRFEQAREGVEDYEYLYLLRALIDRTKASGGDTAAAELAMDHARQLVAIPNAGGRYSSKILPSPQAVYDVRRALAEAIEALSR